MGGWDVHTHIVPAAVIEAARRGRFGMQATEDRVRIGVHQVPLHPISETAQLVERVRADRLDGAIVSIPPPLFRPELTRAERRDYADLVNDALGQDCAAHREILRPLAYLPAEDPEIAIDVVRGLGPEWAGVVMGTDLGPLPFGDKRLDPLWEAICECELAVFIHPGASPDSRLDAYYLHNLIGNPMETTIAAAGLVFAGVLHRHASLKVILAHGGGCVAGLVGRWQRGADTARPGIANLPVPPTEAVRRFYVDSIVHSPSCLSQLCQVFGEDRILLGSDWPFPMGTSSADCAFGRVEPDLARRVRTANAEAAFGRRLRWTGRRETGAGEGNVAGTAGR